MKQDTMSVPPGKAVNKYQNGLAYLTLCSVTIYVAAVDVMIKKKKKGGGKWEEIQS